MPIRPRPLPPFLPARRTMQLCTLLVLLMALSAFLTRGSLLGSPDDAPPGAPDPQGQPLQDPAPGAGDAPTPPAPGGDDLDPARLMAAKFVDFRPLKEFGTTADPEEMAAVHFFLGLCKQRRQEEITSASYGAGLNLPARAVDYVTLTDPATREALRGRPVRIDGRIPPGTEAMRRLIPFENPHVDQVWGTTLRRLLPNGRREDLHVYFLDPGTALPGDHVLLDAYFLKWVKLPDTDNPAGEQVRQPVFVAKGFTTIARRYEGPSGEEAVARIASALDRIHAVPEDEIERRSLGAGLSLPARSVRYESLLDPAARALLSRVPVQIDGTVEGVEIVPTASWPGSGSAAPLPETLHLCRLRIPAARGTVPCLAYLESPGPAAKDRYVRLHGSLADLVLEPHASGIPVRVPVFVARTVAETIPPPGTVRRSVLTGNWLLLGLAVLAGTVLVAAIVVWRDRRQERDFQNRVWQKIRQHGGGPAPRKRPGTPPAAGAADSPPAPPAAPPAAPPGQAPPLP